MKKIKEKILLILLFIFKWHLRSIYFFIKIIHKQKKQVFLLSRQFDEIPLNYELIIKSLEKENIKYKVICKKVSNGINAVIRNEKTKKGKISELNNALKYYFNLYKQMIYSASSKVIIVDGYNLVASMLKHKRNVIVIQLWHALGCIKKFGYQTIGYTDGLNPKIAKMLCMHKNYNYIISGSKAMNKYFAQAFNTTEDKVKEIGTPMIDYLLKDNNKIINKIYKAYPELKNKPNIIYCPTFRNDNSNNLDEIIKKIDTKKYNLLLSFHPKSNIFNKKSVILIDGKKFRTCDIFRVVDYVITDYSALAMECCILNKKLFFYLYDYEKYNKENGININLFNELPSSTSKNIDDILNIIKNDNYNDKEYQKFRKKYVSNLNGNSTEELIEIIKRSIYEKNKKNTN